MVDATIPTPRRISRTPVTQEANAFGVLGDAFSVAGKAGARFEQQRRNTNEQVRQVDHNIAMDEQKRQDDSLYIEKAQEWVRIEEQARIRAAQLREEAEPFAKGHAQRVREEMLEAYRDFDESLTGNERVRQKFRLPMVQSAARIDLQEESWQRQQNFKAQGEALDMTVNTYKNRLARVNPGEAGESFAEAMQQIDAMIDAGAFNDDQAVLLNRAARSKLAEGMNDGLFNANQPQMVKELADKGFFDGLDIDVARIGDQVEGEQRALDIAAERAQKEQQIEARNAMEAVRAKIRIGINPSQGEMDQVLANARAAGTPEADLIAFGGLSVQIGLNRQYSEASDPDGIVAAQAAKALGGKVAAGTASEVEQVAYAHLRGVAEARAKAAGAQRKDMAGKGVQGQLAVLADLDRLPKEQRFLAGQEAMDGLGYVAQLPAKTRNYALAGRELRKARPKDFGSKDQIGAGFREVTADFAGTLGGSHDDMMSLAWDIYAGSRAAYNHDGWDKSEFSNAVNIVFGATRRSDGSVQGGIGEFSDHRVILPVWQTSTDFERVVRKLTFGTAIYSDGRAVSKEDVLGHYRPEYYRDTPDGWPVYKMIDEGGRPLLKQGGGVYDFEVNR